MPEESPASFMVYRYRVKPLREEQLDLAFQALGNCRWVYNQALACDRQAEQSGEKRSTYNQLAKSLVKWKQQHAWLELGQTYSQHAREPNYGGLGWTRVDAADHLLAALEPHVGFAVKLRKWACSSQCALPNTFLAFRRGQLRINAARAKGQTVG